MTSGDPTQLQALQAKAEEVRAELAARAGAGSELSREDVLRISDELTTCIDGLQEWAAARIAEKVVDKARSAT
jgi:hypothetical protein